MPSIRVKSQEQAKLLGSSGRTKRSWRQLADDEESEISTVDRGQLSLGTNNYPGASLIGDFWELLAQRVGSNSRITGNARFENEIEETDKDNNNSNSFCLITSADNLTIDCGKLIQQQEQFYITNLQNQNFQPTKYRSDSEQSREQQYSANFVGARERVGRRKRKKVRKLLKALISDERKSTRIKVLACLMRTPSVLACLFSLFLFTSGIFVLLMKSNIPLRAPETADEIRQLGIDRYRNMNFLLRTNRFQPTPVRRNSKPMDETNENFQKPLTVQTECGSFVGVAEEAAVVFKGIPYAVPPLGPLRWTRPRPIWLSDSLCAKNSTKMADKFKQHCAQISPITKSFSGSEDCLYLDIYLPRGSFSEPEVGKLPVMVYIHGGFLAYGSSGTNPAQDGNVNWMKARPNGQVASALNVIIVAFNFRLQALGFTALSQLAESNGPYGSEGNYGLWDQLAALNWVKRNIESFGGSGENIILFGPDSASSLPLALTAHFELPTSFGDDNSSVAAKPKTRDSSQTEASGTSGQGGRSNNLFRAVWLTNPTVFYNVNYKSANRHYERLFLNYQLNCPRENGHSKRLGETEAEGAPKRVAALNSINATQAGTRLNCLMNLSAKEILQLYLGKDDPAYRLDDQNSLPIHGISADQFVTVDGLLVKQFYPFSMQSNGVDFLIGSTAQAVEYWPCPRNLNQWTWEDFNRYTSTSLNSFNSNLFKLVASYYRIPELGNSTSSISNEEQREEKNSGGEKMGPAETYLTMVSDIKQVCSANKLAQSLKQTKDSRRKVFRYIVENKPENSLKLNHQQNFEQQQQFNHNHSDLNAANIQELNYAFHNWDLIAFFGFESLGEQEFKATAADYGFQSNLRQMVRAFVHGDKMLGEKEIIVLANGDNLRRVESYKSAECEMWQRHLGQNYAWVS